MPKIDSYSLDTSITDTDSLLGVNAADGKTKRYAMSAIKTTLLAGADITEVNTGNGLSGGATSGAVTLIIDTNVVATLTGSQTLTNKTLTAPIISSISNSGTITLPTSSDTLVGRATTDTLTNKTLTTPTITTPIINTGAQLKNGSTSAGFLEFFEDSDNGTNKVTLIGPASTADVTLTLPSATDTLVGLATTDTLTNKTLTSPVLNTGVSGTAILDEDTLSSNSATKLATQQSIKAYIDGFDAGRTETAIANGDYILFLDGGSSGATKKEALADLATLFAGTGLSASNSVLSVDAAQTVITSLLATDIKIGEDDQTKIDFETADTINFYAGNEKQLILTDGALTPGSNAIVDLGTDALEFKDGYFDGTLEADAITIGGTNVVTGSLITTLGTISAGTWNGTAIDTAYIDTTLTSQTSILNSNLVVGRDADNQIKFSTDDEIIFRAAGGDGVTFKASGEIEATSLDISGNAVIAGTLTVSGSTTTINTATLSVEDPLIIVGSGNNSSDAVDLGLYGLYDTSGSQDLYSGLFRDASDSGKWKLFKSLQTAPTTTVNTSGTGYAVDTLVANIEGNVTGNVTGNTSGTAATVTTAAQTNITSLGTLTGLDVNGAVTINDNLSLDGSNKELRFYEAANYVGFEAPALSANQIWVLPSADGSNGTALKTDGSGNLSWGLAGGDVFKTISVSGEDDVVADGISDTLTLVGGTGTVITTNASSDTITISAGANTVEVNEYTGNGSTTQYTLSSSATHENELLVYMDGIYQHHNTYAVSGTTLTFDTNVPNGVKVEVFHMRSVNVSNMVQSATAGTLMDVSATTGDITLNVDLTEAGEAAIANGDYILFLDGGATGTHAKEAIADVATLFAGTGLTAASSVINIDAAQTGITSLLATDIKIGEDDQTKIDFETADEIHFYAANTEQVYVGDNIFGPQSDSDVDLGSTGVRWKDAFVDSITVTGEVDGASLDISGDADIDGTLEADAITVNGSTLASVIAGTTVSNATLAATATVTDSTANTDFPVVFHNESNGLLDDTAAFEYNPSTGTLIVANLDIGTDVDIDGTLEADAITVDGTALNEYIADTVGAMVGSNTETGITVTYEDGDNTLDFAIGSITSLGTITQDTVTFTSANSQDPLIEIKNTTNDANGARLHFVKDKGAAGADGDDIGTIEFISDDDGQTQTSFAKIVAEVSESANTDEAGKLSFYVAESDGTNTALAAGLVLEGEHATDGEVDVTIGAGSSSTLSIAGSAYAAGGKFGIDTGDYIHFTADTQTDFYVNGNNEMRLEADGDLHVDGDVIAYSTTIGSDEKLKTDITVIDNALDKIKQIDGVTFNYKRNNKPSGGVIAQSLEKVMPSVVGTQQSLNGDEEYKTVDYNAVIGLLIESVKELEERLTKCECNKNK